MRIQKPSAPLQEGDMTPMIDMTFQLIAFFMVLINFSQGEQNQRIQLPDSELAKPPDAPLEFPITLHLTKEGTVIIGGDEVTIEGLAPYLSREAAVLQLQGTPQENATIIIRGDKQAPTGKVQELIQKCQGNGFVKFALRAQEDVT